VITSTKIVNFNEIVNNKKFLKGNFFKYEESKILLRRREISI
jgi:hypothetical protein